MKDIDPVARKFLQELRHNPFFQGLMKEFLRFRPVVPVYKPCQSREEADSLMERIKFDSGRKEGFDLIYLYLTGERNE